MYGSMDIYHAPYFGTGFAPSVPVAALNSADSENDLTISSDGSTMIFNRYMMDTGEISLWISFWKQNAWSEPQLLDNINQSGQWELTPTLTPDGQYFLYELEGKIKVMPVNEVIK